MVQQAQQGQPTLLVIIEKDGEIDGLGLCFDHHLLLLSDHCLQLRLCLGSSLAGDDA